MIDLERVAHLEEARQARGQAEVAEESRPFAGGVMCRGKPGFWSNIAVRVAMSGPITLDEIDAMIAFYSEIGSEARAEVTPFADPSLYRGLEARGFGVRFFENMFARELTPTDEPITPLVAPPEGLEIRRVDPTDERAVHQFALTAVSGFFPPGTDLEPQAALASRSARHPRTRAYVAWLDAEPVGAAAMEVAGDIAALFGASVVPQHRKKGVQQALLATRLNEAREAGATLATIGSKPGVATERNVRRMGFQLAYAKLLMARAGPGLMPVLGE
ncbi:MAG: GNAT family N-acetyltransferase [Planctomycetota bacterium]|nr:GNAT family N-acetyltransferase [Planctomycetota bacterium]